MGQKKEEDEEKCDKKRDWKILLIYYDFLFWMRHSPFNDDLLMDILRHQNYHSLN
jgi:hypothetical protein